MANKIVDATQIVPPLRPVLRAADDEDVARNAENKQREEDAFKICQEKIAEYGLDMKLVDVEYTFDRNKLLFYFTSDGRVDFPRFGEESCLHFPYPDRAAADRYP